MKIFKISTQQFPYPLESLKLDFPYTWFPAELEKVDYPNEPFPESLTDTDLSEFDVAIVRYEEKPIYNYLTHDLVENFPQLIDGFWTVTWELRELTPEEIKERTPPDWVGFNEAISFDSNMIDYEFAANVIHPSIVGKKDLAYSIINTGGLDNFAMAFPLFCFLTGVTQEHRDEWANLAESFNLPADFVAVVRGQ
jgi:hypothetical protein